MTCLLRSEWMRNLQRHSHSKCTRSAILFYFHLCTISLSDYSKINSFTIYTRLDITRLWHSEWPGSLQRPSHSECTRSAISFYFHLSSISLSDYSNINSFMIYTRLDITCLLHSEWLRSLQRPSHSECIRSAILFYFHLFWISLSGCYNLIYSQFS